MQDALANSLNEYAYPLIIKEYEQLESTNDQLKALESENSLTKKKEAKAIAKAEKKAEALKEKLGKWQTRLQKRVVDEWW